MASILHLFCSCCNNPIFLTGGQFGVIPSGTGLRRYQDTGIAPVVLWSNQFGSYSNYVGYDTSTSPADETSYNPEGVLYTLVGLATDPARLRLLDFSGNVEWTYTDPDAFAASTGRTFIRGDKCWWLHLDPDIANNWYIRCVDRATGTALWKYDNIAQSMGSFYVDEDQNFWYIRRNSEAYVVDDPGTGAGHYTYSHDLVKIDNTGTLAATIALPDYGFVYNRHYMTPDGEDHFLFAAMKEFRFSGGGSVFAHFFQTRLNKDGSLTTVHQTNTNANVSAGAFPNLPEFVKGDQVVAVQSNAASLVLYDYETLVQEDTATPFQMGLGATILATGDGPGDDVYVATGNRTGVKMIARAFITSVDPVDPSDNTFTVTIGGQTVSVTGNTDVATTGSDLVTALNASVLSNFTPITWSGTGGEIIGTTDANDALFTAVLSVTGSGSGGVVGEFRITQMTGADFGRLNLVTKTQRWVANTHISSGENPTRIASGPWP